VSGPPAVNLDHLAAQIRQEHEAAVAAIRKGCEHAIAAGKLLLEAKEAVPHGAWLKWLKANFPGSTRTAQSYMWLAEYDPNAQRVADLPLRRAILKLQQQYASDRSRAEIEDTRRKFQPTEPVEPAPPPQPIVPEKPDHSDDLIDFALQAADLAQSFLNSLAATSTVNDDVLERVEEARPTQPRERTLRKQQLRERARRALGKLYPDGVPDQINKSNAELVRTVNAQITKSRQQGVSPDTILRAAGRRK
jgi:Protein of unknown function (DUF3102)